MRGEQLIFAQLRRKMLLIVAVLIPLTANAVQADFQQNSNCFLGDILASMSDLMSSREKGDDDNVGNVAVQEPLKVHFEHLKTKMNLKNKVNAKNSAANFIKSDRRSNKNSVGDYKSVCKQKPIKSKEERRNYFEEDSKNVFVEKVSVKTCNSKVAAQKREEKLALKSRCSAPSSCKMYVPVLVFSQNKRNNLRN